MVPRPPGARGADQGFSLIELVVAMVVLGTMAVAVIGVIMNSQSQGVTNRSRIAAANLAAREIDLVREEFARTDAGPVNLAAAGYVLNPHPLAGGTAGQPLIIDGRKYTVVRTAQWNISGTGASACEGGALVAYPTLGVTVSVTWPNMGNVQPVVSTASLAPDKETGIATTDSFIAAKVLDQEAKPLTGVPVTATGGATTTGYTDASGCAVIRISPPLAGASYTIAVADGSYVDLSGTSNPSKNSGVIMQSQIYAGASFTVARAGSVTVKLVRSDGQPLTNAQVTGCPHARRVAVLRRVGGERARRQRGEHHVHQPVAHRLRRLLRQRAAGRRLRHARSAARRSRDARPSISRWRPSSPRASPPTRRACSRSRPGRSPTPARRVRQPRSPGAVRASSSCLPRTTSTPSAPRSPARPAR